jgi:hypothetical protein
LNDLSNVDSLRAQKLEDVAQSNQKALEGVESPKEVLCQPKEDRDVVATKLGT